ncbi:MFS transporter [Mycobacteroides abscessus]|uniref:MFS transporter n=1 Tax=Mycobacteroides abscessus TaxID=36809 RepID=UPI0009A771D7|nr:MFS transporter [Mycobacteroides abscessus]
MGIANLSKHLDLLQQREYRRLFIAQSLSKAGSEFSLIAVAFGILDLGGSASDLGLALMSRTLPPLFLMVVGGVLSDRIPRARLMIWADSIACLAQLGLAALFLSGTLVLPVLILCQALLGSATAIFRPAIAALIPEIVTADKLVQANSSLSIASNAAALLGPVSAGMLLVFVSPAWIIFADAGSFGLSALLMMSLTNVGADRSSKVRPSVRRELLDGWRYVVNTRWILVATFQFLLFQAGFTTFFIIGPLLAHSRHSGNQAWGALVAAFGAGALIGGLVAIRYQPRHPLITMQLMLGLTLPLLGGMAIDAPFILIFMAAALAGGAFSLSDIIWDSYLQLVTPNDRLGLVFSITSFGSAALRPFGYLVTGTVADAFGAPVTFAITAIGLLISTSIALTLLLPIRKHLLNPLLTPTTKQEVK